MSLYEPFKDIVDKNPLHTKIKVILNVEYLKSITTPNTIITDEISDNAELWADNTANIIVNHLKDKL